MPPDDAKLWGNHEDPVQHDHADEYLSGNTSNPKPRDAGSRYRTGSPPGQCAREHTGATSGPNSPHRSPPATPQAPAARPAGMAGQASMGRPPPRPSSQGRAKANRVQVGNTTVHVYGTE
eukprot:14579940-Heterocapsa_arctica.AAC.1